MQYNHLTIILFLAACAAAVSLVHLVMTSRDRGVVSTATLLIAVIRGVMLLRKLAPTRVHL